MDKYRWLLRHVDEDSLRERLIESDFDWKNLTKGDGFLLDHLKRFIAVMFLIKYSLFTLETSIWLQIDRRPILWYLLNPMTKPAQNGLYGTVLLGVPKGIVLFPVFFLGFCSGSLDYSSIRQEYKAQLPEKFRGPSSVHLKHSMVLRNLVTFILLPLLTLFPLFSSLHTGYSTQECLNIFAVLTIGNCFFYLSSIYWKAGLFLFDLNSSLTEWLHWLMTGFQFGIHALGQIAFLSTIIYNFNFVGFSAKGSLLLLFILTLSDLAVLLYLCELAISTHGRVFSAKFEKRTDFPPSKWLDMENRACYPVERSSLKKN